PTLNSRFGCFVSTSITAKSKTLRVGGMTDRTFRGVILPPDHTRRGEARLHSRGRPHYLILVEHNKRRGWGLLFLTRVRHNQIRSAQSAAVALFVRNADVWSSFLFYRDRDLSRWTIQIETTLIKQNRIAARINQGDGSA